MVIELTTIHLVEINIEAFIVHCPYHVNDIVHKRSQLLSRFDAAHIITHQDCLNHSQMFVHLFYFDMRMYVITVECCVSHKGHTNFTAELKF